MIPDDIMGDLIPQILDMSPTIGGMNISAVLHGRGLHPVEEFIARLDMNNPEGEEDLGLYIEFFYGAQGETPSNLCTLRGHVGAGKRVGNEIRNVRPGAEFVATWDIVADGMEQGAPVDLAAKVSLR